eukprot:12496449-Alexandrium_andersonii.AAC.1
MAEWSPLAPSGGRRSATMAWPSPLRAMCTSASRPLMPSLPRVDARAFSRARWRAPRRCRPGPGRVASAQ